MAEDLSFWADIVFKVGTPVVLCAMFFLRKSFASHEEVRAVNERVTAIETAIKVMVEQNKVFERHERRLEDHETRLRGLEHAA